MSEKKPVICPNWHEMKLHVERRKYDWTHPPLNDLWFAHYYCDCGWIAPDDGTGDTKQEAIEAAYLAATCRPPNRPLTRKQVEAMDGYDAVWSVNKRSYYLYRPMSAKDIQELLECESVNYCENLWYFASKPTQSDIKSAMAEKGADLNA